MKLFVRFFIAVLAAVSILPLIASNTADSSGMPTLTVFTDGEEIEMNLEEYTLRVLANEGIVCESPETLKALAVAIRSCGAYLSLYGLKHEDYNACADARCCMPLADTSEVDASFLSKCTKAVNETKGEVLTLDRLPTLALFTLCASSGTRTCENLPYLSAIASDGICEKHFREITVTKYEFCSLLPAHYENGESCLVYSENGKCEFGVFGGKRVSSEQLIAAFSLTSYEFTLEINEDTVSFRCFGAGNGCGLDICRADRLANGQIGYKEIIEIFYPKLTLNKIYHS